LIQPRGFLDVAAHFGISFVYGLTHSDLANCTFFSHD
jgi:hypothetical protein